jgi:hypothetical protein
VLNLDQIWRLSKAWFGADRRAPEWRRPSPEETERIFTNVGLTEPFWRLR